MSRQRRSHQKARAIIAQSPDGALFLQQRNAERNRNRVAVATASGTTWNAERAAVTADNAGKRVAGMDTADKRTMFASLTVGPRSSRRHAAYDVNGTAIVRTATAERAPRDADFRYVLYVAPVAVYAPLSDVDNPAWNNPMLPSTAFSAVDYHHAQSSAWDVYRTMRDNGHVVSLQRFHEYETAEPMTQGAARLRQSQWMNLPLDIHRAAAVTMHAQDCEYAERNANAVPPFRMALTDGFIDAAYVMLASEDDSCR